MNNLPRWLKLRFVSAFTFLASVPATVQSLVRDAVHQHTDTYQPNFLLN